MFLTEKNRIQCENAMRLMDPPDANRVSGECVCEICGCKYYDHPEGIPWTFLTLLCNGKYVKL